MEIITPCDKIPRSSAAGFFIIGISFMEIFHLVVRLLRLLDYYGISVSESYEEKGG
jgi:hypothetical protein